MSEQEIVKTYRVVEQIDNGNCPVLQTVEWVKKPKTFERVGAKVRDIVVLAYIEREYRYTEREAWERYAVFLRTQEKAALKELEEIAWKLKVADSKLEG